MRASLLASLPYMMAEPTAFRWLCLQGLVEAKLQNATFDVYHNGGLC